MLHNLCLYNFPTGYNHLASKSNADRFQMATCQRTLIVSLKRQPELEPELTSLTQFSTGPEAYQYLLEIICGLQSKLIGENEIVGQFKKAHQQFVQMDEKDTKLLKIIEKLLKDAKEIRTSYLLGLCQKTYASITRKYVMAQKADCIVILGSGSLAEDLINQFKKKTRTLICARNINKVKNLVNTHGIEFIPWSERASLVSYPFIINTIGVETPLYDKNFFIGWKSLHENKLFVDLGSANTIDPECFDYPELIGLDQIFEEGAVHEGHKLEKISAARNHMRKLVDKREKLFKQTIGPMSFRENYATAHAY